MTKALCSDIPIYVKQCFMSWVFKGNSLVLFVLKAVFQTQCSEVWLTGSIHLLAQTRTGINDFCTRFNTMELACVSDLSFPRRSHTAQDCSSLLLSTGWKGAHTSWISAPQLLHYPRSWSRQSFYCTQAQLLNQEQPKLPPISFTFWRKTWVK